MPVASALVFSFAGAFVVGPFTEVESRAALGGVDVGVLGARLKNSVMGLPWLTELFLVFLTIQADVTEMNALDRKTRPVDAAYSFAHHNVTHVTDAKQVTDAPVRDAKLHLSDLNALLICDAMECTSHGASGSYMLLRLSALKAAICHEGIERVGSKCHKARKEYSAN